MTIYGEGGGGRKGGEGGRGGGEGVAEGMQFMGCVSVIIIDKDAKATL